MLRTHLTHQVEVAHLALLDAAVIGPRNTPFTEHQKQYAEGYRTMPSDVFADIIDRRIRTASHRTMTDAVAANDLAPGLVWTGRRWVDQVGAVRHQDTREAVAQLDLITAPILVLWGEQDYWLPPRVGHHLASAIPTARGTAQFPTPAPFLAEDAPEQTAEALLHFGKMRPHRPVPGWDHVANSRRAVPARHEPSTRTGRPLAARRRTDRVAGCLALRRRH